MNFVDALKIAQDVMDQYRADHPKWWKRMDGTPILNDIPVRMASEFALRTAQTLPAGLKQRPPNGCYCPQGKCMAPKIMGVQQPCLRTSQETSVAPGPKDPRPAGCICGDQTNLRCALHGDPRNEGHGHVKPRADGVRARCGGPAMCDVCAREKISQQQPSAAGV